MTPDLQNKLYEKYPKLFAQRKLPMTHTAMCWGIDCGDGWYNILNKLCGNIQSYVDQQREYRARELRHQRAIKRAVNGDKTALVKFHMYHGQITSYTHKAVEADIADAMVGKERYIRGLTPQVPKIQAVQVKEKFGTLRFYTNCGNEYIDGLIAMAEAMSAVTCEECGKPGKVRGGGWIYVACDEHTQVQDKDD